MVAYHFWLSCHQNLHTTSQSIPSVSPGGCFTAECGHQCDAKQRRLSSSLEMQHNSWRNCKMQVDSGPRTQDITLLKLNAKKSHFQNWNIWLLPFAILLIGLLGVCITCSRYFYCVYHKDQTHKTTREAVSSAWRWRRISEILLMEEILHHLGCIEH